MQIKVPGMATSDAMLHDGGNTVRAWRVMAINPGSTSTKLSFFHGEREFLHHSIAHEAEDLKPFKRVTEQSGLRMSLIRRCLDDAGVDVGSADAVIGRGGLLRPIPSGVYLVNDEMLKDLTANRFGEHASNLGGILAAKLAEMAGCPAFIADPVVVDEMDEIARISGMPEIKRRSIFHALNQKSVAREVAEKIGKPYHECNFIVAHMGGGISVGAHCRGRVVDVNNALDGDGPFAPERSGTLPSGQLVEMCFSGRHAFAEMKRKLAGSGGLVAHRGSNSFAELKNAVSAGDARSRSEERRVGKECRSRWSPYH